MNMKSFSPGTLVKVTKGAFVGRPGIALDPEKAVDGRGGRFPAPTSGYFWVMLTLNDSLFPAHLHQDEIEAMPQSDT
jgi:hypothetical protein